MLKDSTFLKSKNYENEPHNITKKMYENILIISQILILIWTLI